MSQFVDEEDFDDCEPQHEEEVEQDSEGEEEEEAAQTTEQAFQASQRLDEEDVDEVEQRVDDGADLRAQATQICALVTDAAADNNLAFLKLMAVILKSDWLRKRIWASTCAGIQDLRENAKNMTKWCKFMKTLNDDHPNNNVFSGHLKTATKIVNKFPDKFANVCASDETAMFEAFKGFKLKTMTATVELAMTAEEKAEKDAKKAAEKAKRTAIKKAEQEASQKRAAEQMKVFTEMTATSSARPKRGAAQEATQKIAQAVAHDAQPSMTADALASDSEEEHEAAGYVPKRTPKRQKVEDKKEEEFKIIMVKLQTADRRIEQLEDVLRQNNIDIPPVIDLTADENEGNGKGKEKAVTEQ